MFAHHAPNKRIALIKIIATATRIPSCFRGIQLTNLAAIGAIRIPPNARPPTADQSISNLFIFNRNPTLAQTATINSAADTVPITLRGSVFVVANKVGVTTGPQPPPPDASMKPPEKPKNVR